MGKRSFQPDKRGRVFPFQIAQYGRQIAGIFVEWLGIPSV